MFDMSESFVDGVLFLMMAFTFVGTQATTIATFGFIFYSHLLNNV